MGVWCAEAEYAGSTHTGSVLVRDSMLMYVEKVSMRRKR
jgi:hypothetical protein